ncbi:hypothetical protein JI57_03270 [Psychromonas sp. PRT-SC03]|nr:hypothetical protein JI57_03270 [Psychromonas sp. PRT-SC03]
MKIKLVVVFICFYLFSLIWTLPATLIQPLLTQNSALKIDKLSGTIWQGYAQNISYQDDYQLSYLQWSINWRSLWTLALSVDVKFNNTAPRFQGKGELAVNLTQASLNTVSINLKASDVSPYLVLPIPVEAQGKIHLEIKKAIFEAKSCKKLDAYLVWGNARVNSVMGNINLANVDVDLSCSKNSLIAKVEQVSTDVKTQLRVELQQDGRYQLRGKIKEGPTLAKNMQQGFSWLGRKGPDGNVALAYSGRL